MELQGYMGIAESIGIGLGLAAAAGFRTLTPFLVLSAVALFGHIQLTDQMAWLGTYPAFISLALALALEVTAYFVPWLDMALDTIALPLATIAGTGLMALATSHFDPLLQWSLAIVAGGGTAATVRGMSGLTRLISTATTGGLTNFIVAIAELLGAIALSVLALTMPLVVVVVVLVLLAIALWLLWRLRSVRQQATSTPEM
jgi:hypothetical protein